jgi:hypothetical protein
MLRIGNRKIEVWKALVLAGLFLGYAENGLSGQKKLQQEQAPGRDSEVKMVRIEAKNTTGPEILLRSIFNFF